MPVTAEAFRDRNEELRLLEGAVEDLSRGNPRWFALIGARKIGKTSLLLELQRRRSTKSVVFAVLDSFEECPLTLAVFKRLALRVIDAFFSRQVGLSLESLAHRPVEYRAALMTCKEFRRLPQDLASSIMELAEMPFDRHFVETTLRLPQALARSLGKWCVVAWDEFQEVSELSAGRAKLDVLALARSVWQKHDRVNYIISGSNRSTLTEMTTGERSPFFQHFSVLEIKAMAEEEAVALLQECAPRERAIPGPLAEKAVAVFGGHPFYLQLFGEQLTRSDPPYDEAALKAAVSELLFSRTGRLALYFQREHDAIVGKAGTLAAVLRSLCDGPRQMSEIAAETKSSTASTARYLDRLRDVVSKREDGRYEIADPVYALWVRWVQPEGKAVPMSVLGNEAELTVARALAAMGFELIYQSRASRGAFDLLGVRAGVQLGLQVKRSPLPVRFTRAQWNRLHADAERFRWRFVIAAVSPADNKAVFLDPAKARIARAVTIGADARIVNLLEWL